MAHFPEKQSISFFGLVAMGIGCMLGTSWLLLTGTWLETAAVHIDLPLKLPGLPHAGEPLQLADELVALAPGKSLLQQVQVLLCFVLRENPHGFIDV